MKCPQCRTDNPKDSKYCMECATPLPPSTDVPSLRTETVSTPLKELTTGSTFAGRYQIIEELGHGGMGKVYRALDKKLNEEVALKLIKPEIALDKGTLERFQNELKVARKISHRHVGRMYELMEDQGLHFITMEYVPGEDLRSFLHRSKQLTIGTAVAIATEVCEGLAEAHRLGVVHRDLKPSNIIIDKDGNARIMDFGIARSLRTKSITGEGVIIGTPEYMSPEQVEGKEVDQRSDIYSLGIILYEMVTGRVPFEGDTPFTIGVKHKSERPRNPRELNPQLGDDLSRVILRCLEKDKAKRFQTAEELHADLEKVEQGLPTTERLVSKRKSITSKEITVTFSARKLVIPAIAFLTLVAVGIILWRVLPSKKPALVPSAPGQPTLAVLYFENKSGDTKLDNWRDGLAELLITSLQQSRYIRVISGDEMYTILKRLGLADARKHSSEDIEKIAALTRATHVLRGSFLKAGESFIITAGLQRLGTGQSPTALRLEAHDEKDIIPKMDELTRQVKEGLNLTAAQIFGDIEKEAGKITTSSPEALKYYIEGRRFHNENKDDQAIAYMEKAVDIDPEFAMAYRSLAMSYINSGHTAEARKFLKKALELGAHLPENEKLLIEANVFYLDEDYAKEIELLERLVKTYPGYLIAHSWLANAYESVGNFDKAIEHEEFVIQSWETALGVTNLAEFYMAKGFYQKAEDVCRSFLKDVEDNASIHAMLGGSYLCRRQFDPAIAEVEKAYLLDLTLKPWMGWFLLCKDDLVGAEKILGNDALLLIRGQFNKNINLSQQSLEESKGNKEKEAGAYGGLAGALEKAGRFVDAYQAFGQCLRLSAEYRRSAGESGSPYLPSQQKSDISFKGALQAKMKSFDEAKKTAEELKSLIEKGINTTGLRDYEYILGMIELGKKNYRQAADLFSRACGRLSCENPGSADAFEQARSFDALARALYESGELEKARQEYEKITLLTIGRLGDGDLYAKAFYMLGKIAEQQGDKARARENYRKFLDLWKDADPGLPEVADAKARLARLGDN